MDSGTKLEFIAEMTKAVAWPVTVGIIIILFYPQIVVKIEKLRAVESKGVTYSWGSIEATNKSGHKYPMFSMNFRTIEQMQKEPCMVDADEALKNSGFENITHKESGLVWGFQEEYTGAVICRYENDVAVFIVSGPTIEQSTSFRVAMEREFHTLK